MPLNDQHVINPKGKKKMQSNTGVQKPFSLKVSMWAKGVPSQGHAGNNERSEKLGTLPQSTYSISVSRNIPG